jgi:hypothetical protein
VCSFSAFDEHGWRPEIERRFGRRSLAGVSTTVSRIPPRQRTIMKSRLRYRIVTLIAAAATALTVAFAVTGQRSPAPMGTTGVDLPATAFGSFRRGRVGNVSPEALTRPSPVSLRKNGPARWSGGLSKTGRDGP